MRETASLRGLVMMIGNESTNGNYHKQQTERDKEMMHEP